MSEKAPISITLSLEPNALEILNRLRGDMTPSMFIQLLLRMADSGAVGPLPEAIKKPEHKSS